VHVSYRSSLVRRSAEPTTALAGVDAELVSGEVLAVSGRSGSGKSTLVSVLAGLQKPTRGEVLGADDLATTRGAAPWRWRSRDLAARLSWVPQTPEVGIVTGTVWDEVMASARAVGVEEGVAHARAERLLEALGLGHLTAASPYHLSGGEQRRLMVAAAVTHGPSGLLLDEPTVGQDRGTWAAVTGVIAAARRAGSAVALASHDAEAVSALADRTVHLEQGLVR
jgi:energy-coupling factor transport system ATP-binding protein